MFDPKTQYAGAWGEISARIQARDRVLLTYISFTATLVGVSFAKSDFSLIAIVVGYFSLAMALLSRHHDLIIGLLSEFQLSLVGVKEQFKEDENINYKPWHHQDFLGKALKARTIRDISQILFIILGITPAFYIMMQSKFPNYDFISLLLYGSIISAFIAVIIVWNTRSKRNKIFNN